MTDHYSDQLEMLKTNQVYEPVQEVDLVILSKGELKNRLVALDQQLVDLHAAKQNTTNEISLIVDELSKRS